MPFTPYSFEAAQSQYFRSLRWCQGSCMSSMAFSQASRFESSDTPTMSNPLS